MYFADAENLRTCSMSPLTNGLLRDQDSSVHPSVMRHGQRRRFFAFFASPAAAQDSAQNIESPRLFLGGNLGQGKVGSGHARNGYAKR